MLKTKINLKAELPYSIELSNNGNIVYGAGKTPATATMAALSIAKMIPSGLRDNMEAARIIFWDYKTSHNWARLIHILTEDTFNKEDFCLYCGAKLDFEPTKDGGFCSTECEDSYYETGGIEEN